MGIPTAPKKKARAPAAFDIETTKDYVGKRITAASDQGYSSTKVWLNSAQSALIVSTLNDMSYHTEQEQEDPATGRVQIKVSW